MVREAGDERGVEDGSGVALSVDEPHATPRGGLARGEEDERGEPDAAGDALDVRALRVEGTAEGAEEEGSLPDLQLGERPGALSVGAQEDADLAAGARPADAERTRKEPGPRRVQPDAQHDELPGLRGSGDVRAVELLPPGIAGHEASWRAASPTGSPAPRAPRPAPPAPALTTPAPSPAAYRRSTSSRYATIASAIARAITPCPSASFR